MSATFKVKNKKIERRQGQILETLDSKHKEMVKDIETITSKLPELKKVLTVKKTQLDELNTRLNTTNIDINVLDILDDDSYRNRYALEEVIDELEKGYTLNDKVIRFAKVVVGA